MNKIEFLGVRVRVRLNLSARDWRLYDIEGAEDAAQNLNRDIEVLLAEGDLGGLSAALSRYSKWGAADTEGFLVLHHILDQCGVRANHYI
jgi:hypothetical protein